MFDDSSLFSYKSSWNKRIANTLQLMKQDYSKNSNADSAWQTIAFILMNKKLGIETDLKYYHNKEREVQTPECHLPEDTAIPNLPSTSTATSSISNSVSSSTVTTSSISNSVTSSTKPQKLLPGHIEQIKSMYQKLDTNKMWVLSTGTIVEKKMEEHAMTCIIEHPSNSIILDASEKCWIKYFTKDELKEINEYNKKTLPSMPTEVLEYMNQFRTIGDLEDLYSKINEKPLHPNKDSALKWIQDSLYDCTKLFMCNYFPLTDQSEGDLLHRVWSSVEKAFDHGIIKCRSGEKASGSSSDSRNQSRCLGGLEKMERKLAGRKMDLIFVYDGIEFGCAECPRFNSINDTKELIDGCFKLPKVMKDMFVSLCDGSPSLKEEIVLSAFLLSETKITSIFMDSPAGYVCRVNRTSPLYYPKFEGQISRRMLPILELIYRTKASMEKTQELIENDNSEITINFSFKDNSQAIPPCFQPNSYNINTKKRKSVQSDSSSSC